MLLSKTPRQEHILNPKMRRIPIKNYCHRTLPLIRVIACLHQKQPIKDKFAQAIYKKLKEHLKTKPCLVADLIFSPCHPDPKKVLDKIFVEQNIEPFPLEKEDEQICALAAIYSLNENSDHLNSLINELVDDIEKNIKYKNSCGTHNNTFLCFAGTLACLVAFAIVCVV